MGTYRNNVVASTRRPFTMDCVQLVAGTFTYYVHLVVGKRLNAQTLMRGGLMGLLWTFINSSRPRRGHFFSSTKPPAQQNPGSAALQQSRHSSGLSLGYSYWAADQIVVPYLLSWILAPDRIVRRVDTKLSLVNGVCDFVSMIPVSWRAAPTR